MVFYAEFSLQSIIFAYFLGKATWPVIQQTVRSDAQTGEAGEGR